MLFDHHTPSDCQKVLPKLSEAIAKGFGAEQLRKDYPLFSKPDFDELYLIAKARLHADKLPQDLGFLLLYTEEQLRFATNWLVAEHRASRLKCNILIEVGCGIGVQTIAFARQCKQVIAIDIDPVKLKYAEVNAALAGCHNIQFMLGDAIHLISKLTGADILFCEPERAAAAEERKFSDLQPNISLLLKRAAPLTKDCCIELPPQLKSIPLIGEREYVSISGKLNRLQVYTGTLAQCAISVVALPTGARIAHDADDRKRLPKAVAPAKFLYQLDTALMKAELQHHLLGSGAVPVSAEFFTSVALISHPFFASTYRVLAKVPFDRARILAELQRLKAGTAVLRYSIAPERYWKERQGYERHLSGSRAIHVFAFGNAYLAEQV